MAETARAVFLAVGANQWQNYYQRQTVAGHSHLPFEVTGRTISETGGQDTVSIRLPDLEAVAAAGEAALAAGSLVTCTIYGFSQPTVADALPGTESVIAEFRGRLVAMARDFVEISWTLGTALSTRQASATGMVYTTQLVGVPLRL